MNSHEEKPKTNWYKIIPIILSLVIIALNIYNISLNLPTPRLEVGLFPYEGIVFSPTVEVVVSDSPNETYQITNLTGQEFEAHSLYNFTFQVYNSGKGSAHDVRVSLVGEPTEFCQVISTSVFVGEPLKGNLLDTVHSEYKIGLLGAGKSYTFLFSVKVFRGTFEERKYVLSVTSKNAGTKIRNIIFE